MRNLLSFFLHLASFQLIIVPSSSSSINIINGGFEYGAFNSWNHSLFNTYVIDSEVRTGMACPEGKFCAVVRSPPVLGVPVSGNSAQSNIDNTYSYISQEFTTSISTHQIVFSSCIICLSYGIQGSHDQYYAVVELKKNGTQNSGNVQSVKLPCTNPSCTVNANFSCDFQNYYFSVDSLATYSIVMKVYQVQSQPWRDNFGYFDNVTALRTYAPTISPTSAPTGQPSTCSVASIPADFALPLLTSVTTGPFYASSPVCAHASSCLGSYGQFTPSTNSYILSRKTTPEYLASATFTSTFYDIGPSSSSRTATISLGGSSVRTAIAGQFMLSPCSQVSIIVKTPVVYVDDFSIAIAYFAADSIGRLQCDYSSVSMVITNGPKILISNVGCQVSTNPTGHCTFQSSNGQYNSLFIGAMYTVVVDMSTSHTHVTATSSLYFHPQRVEVVDYESLRLYVALPQSAVYPRDTLTWHFYINASTFIGTVAFDLNYNSTQLEYVVNSATSNTDSNMQSLFTPSELTTSGYAHIVFAKNKISEVTGSGLILIGTVQFLVSDTKVSQISTVTATLTAVVGLQSTTYCDNNANDLPCSSQNPSYGHLFSGLTEDCLFLDINGSPGHYPGYIAIEAPTIVGIYATSSYATIMNTASMNGIHASDLMTIYATYNTPRSFWPDIYLPGSSLSCTLSQSDKKNLAVYSNTNGYGCKVEVTSKNSGNFETAYSVKATYLSYGVVGAYRIYFPTNFSVIATRRLMRRLSTSSCLTNMLFESSFIRVLATITAGYSASLTITNVDVTNLMTLSVSDGRIGSYSTISQTISGKAEGLLKLVATGVSANITLSNASFSVSQCRTKILSLVTFAYDYKTINVAITPSSVSELSSLTVSLTISTPKLNGETIYNTGIPNQNFAKLVTYAFDEDGYFTDVSQYPGLVLTSIDPTNVNVSTLPGLFWFAYVPPYALSTAGNLLVAALHDSCGEDLTSNSTTLGYINTTAGTPCNVHISSTSTLFTIPGSCASQNPFNIPSSAIFTANLFLQLPGQKCDGSTLAQSPPTQFLITATPGVIVHISSTANVANFVVSPLSKVGRVTITVNFPNFHGAAGINTSITINIVSLDPQLQITSSDYPEGTISPFTHLKVIECSGVYQRASFKSIANISDGFGYSKAFVVTDFTIFSIANSSNGIKLLNTADTPSGKFPGRAVLAASSNQSRILVFGRLCSASGNITMSSGGVVNVVSLKNLQYGTPTAQQPIGKGCNFPSSVYTVSTSRLIGCGATETQGCIPSSLVISFGDGTFLRYASLSKIDLFPGKLLSFISSDPDFVAVNGSTGSLLAVANSYKYASITVNVLCYSTKRKLSTHTNVSYVAANIFPKSTDVKLGYFTGLSFLQCNNSVYIPITFNTPVRYYLGAADTFVYFRRTDLAASTSTGDNDVIQFKPRVNTDFYTTSQIISNGPTTNLFTAIKTIGTSANDQSIGSFHLYDSSYTGISTSTVGNGALVQLATIVLHVNTIEQILTEITAYITGLFLDPINDNSLQSSQFNITSSSATQCFSCSGYVKLNGGTKLDNSSKLKINRKRYLTENPDLLKKRNLNSFDSGSNNGFIVIGDVSGNGVCGSEDIILTQTFYTAISSHTPVDRYKDQNYLENHLFDGYNGHDFLYLNESKSACLSLNYATPTQIKYLTGCQNPSDYCNYGDYTVDFVMTNQIAGDLNAIINTYNYKIPIVQFPYSGTPCDLVSQLPSGSLPHMDIEVVLYTANYNSPTLKGIPSEPVTPNTQSFPTAVYFEVNINASEITGFANKENRILSKNIATGSTVVGPAKFKGNGIFAVSFTVSSLKPVDEFYLVAVGVQYNTSIMSTGAPPYSSYAGINYHYPGTSTKYTNGKFIPVYNSSKCPKFPTVMPTQAPTISTPPTAIPSFMPTISPTQIPTLTPSNVPTINPTATPTSVPTKAPTAVPTLQPSQMPTIYPTPSSYGDIIFIFNHTINYIDHCLETLHGVPGYIDDVYKETVQHFISLLIVELIERHSLSQCSPGCTNCDVSFNNLTAYDNLHFGQIVWKFCEKPYNSSLIKIFETSYVPSVQPTHPTLSPSTLPSSSSSMIPSCPPSSGPSAVPSTLPPSSPSAAPSNSSPSTCPTVTPTMSPSKSVVTSNFPSTQPHLSNFSVISTAPSSATNGHGPSRRSLKAPNISDSPSIMPTLAPVPSAFSSSYIPTISPSSRSINPSTSLSTVISTEFPTLLTRFPSKSPTAIPTVDTISPSYLTTILPIASIQSLLPTVAPVFSSSSPSKFPTPSQTLSPSSPSSNPSTSPSIPTILPSNSPTLPTMTASKSPTLPPTINFIIAPISSVPPSYITTTTSESDVFKLLSSIDLKVEVRLRIAPFSNISTLICDDVFNALGTAILNGQFDSKLQLYALQTLPLPPVQAFRFARSGGLRIVSCGDFTERTAKPSLSPSPLPRSNPTQQPTLLPTPLPTLLPTPLPTLMPTVPLIAADASSDSKVNATQTIIIVVPICAVVCALIAVITVYLRKSHVQGVSNLSSDNTQKWKSIVPQLETIFHATMDRLYIIDYENSGTAAMFRFDDLRLTNIYPSSEHSIDEDNRQTRSSFQIGRQPVQFQPQVANELSNSNILAVKSFNSNDRLGAFTINNLYTLVLGYILNNSLTIIRDSKLDVFEVEFHLLKKRFDKERRDRFKCTFRTEGEFFGLWKSLHQVYEVIYEVDTGYQTRLESKYISIHRLTESRISRVSKDERAFYQGPEDQLNTTIDEMLAWIESLNDIINEFFVDTKALFNPLEKYKRLESLQSKKSRDESKQQKSLKVAAPEGEENRASVINTTVDLRGAAAGSRASVAFRPASALVDFGDKNTSPYALGRGSARVSGINPNLTNRNKHASQPLTQSHPYRNPNSSMWPIEEDTVDSEVASRLSLDAPRRSLDFLENNDSMQKLRLGRSRDQDNDGSAYGFSPDTEVTDEPIEH